MSEQNHQGVCEVLGGHCKGQQPATLRYLAIGSGYMRLCAEHGAKHVRTCERWTGEQWQSPAFAGFDLNWHGRQKAEG